MELAVVRVRLDIVVGVTVNGSVFLQKNCGCQLTSSKGLMRVGEPWEARRKSREGLGNEMLMRW